MDARGYTRILVVVLGLVTPGALANEVPAAPSKATGPSGLTLEGTLKKRVDFWISVYTKYSTSEGVIHDAKYPEIVLEKLDTRPSEIDYRIPPKTREKRAQRRLDDVKDFYRKLLLS